MSFMVVVVCGSRRWRNRQRIGHRLSLLPKDVIIIQGAAPGADTIAGEEALALGLGMIAVPADWKHNGNAAGPMRNNKMLSMLLKAQTIGHEIMVIAFHEDPNLGVGTKDMVQKARDHRVLVEVNLCDE